MDPVLIHEALIRHADALDKGEEIKRVLGPGLGEGLLTADGSHWRWQRQSMAPAFQHGRLLALLPAMIVAAEETRDRWRDGGPGTTRDVGHDMMVTTFKTDGSVDRSEPFASGWLDEAGGGYRGRPVDVAELADGSLLVSDDQEGAIYRISYGR